MLTTPRFPLLQRMQAGYPLASMALTLEGLHARKGATSFFLPCDAALVKGVDPEASRCSAFTSSQVRSRATTSMRTLRRAHNSAVRPQISSGDGLTSALLGSMCTTSVWPSRAARKSGSLNIPRAGRGWKTHKRVGAEMPGRAFRLEPVCSSDVFRASNISTMSLSF